MNGIINVTLISTEHVDSGKCNSDELLKIVESIQPDVIFEEEPNDANYHNSYNDPTSFKSLEVQTVIKYKTKREVTNLPVDKPIDEYASLFSLNALMDEYRCYGNYNMLIKEHCFLRDNYGLEFLNSERCSEMFRKMKYLERYIVHKDGPRKAKLIQLFNIFHQELNNRENWMLKNIYKFIGSNEVNQAVFFLGYTHRDSIIEKISEIRKNGNTQINWNFYKGNID